LSVTGFYLMHRGWQENPMFGREPHSRRDAWVWLIEHAAFKDTRVGVAGKSISINRGQLCYSLRYMASAWGWDDAKVRRFLARAELEKMIACVADAGQTVITICNYDAYQTTDSVDDAPPDAAATQQRRSGDANKNEGKELKEDSEEPSGSSADASAPPPPPLDLKSIVFGQVLTWLVGASSRSESSVRAWLGKCCRDYGDGNVIMAAATIRAGPAPVDPFSRMVDELKRMTGTNGKSPRQSAEDKSRRLAEGMAGALVALGVECGGTGASPGRADFSGDFGGGIIIDADRSENAGGHAAANA
jgi:hypothetical protein